MRTSRKSFSLRSCSYVLAFTGFSLLSLGLCLGSAQAEPKGNVQTKGSKENGKLAAQPEGSSSGKGAAPKGEAQKKENPANSSGAKSGSSGDSLKAMFGGEAAAGKGGPLYIKSDTLELNSKDRIFTYRGNVELVRDDMRITSKVVEGRYGTDNQLETVLCTGDVVITKGEGMKATANRGLYRVAAAVVELTEGPELYRDGNVLAADKVTVYLNEDRSEAEGNVRVKVIKPNDTAP